MIDISTILPVDEKAVQQTIEEIKNRINAEGFSR